MKRTVPSLGGNLRDWAHDVTEYLRSLDTENPEGSPILPLLMHQRGATQAQLDGLLMYDPEQNSPVFSRAGGWVPLHQQAIAFSVPAGSFLDNSVLPHASGAPIAGVANRFDLFLWKSPVDLLVDQLGLSVTTGVAGALAKVVVYNAATANLQPTSLVLETSNLDCATAGLKMATTPPLAIKRDRWFWLGVRHSSTASVRSIPKSAGVDLGYGTNGNGVSPSNALRRTLAFATAAPANWGYLASELVSLADLPSVRMRAA